MKIFFIILLLFIFMAIIVAVLVAILLTIQSQRTESHRLFLKGKIPTAPPDGPYQGSASFNQSLWKGKKFDAAKKSGINILQSGEKYVFTTSQTKSMIDGKLDVIRLDYRQPGNPFWLKLVTDEIVEIEPGKLLGKVFLRIIPGMPFDLGHFRLSK